MRDYIKKHRLGTLAGFLGLSSGVAALGSKATEHSVNTWYQTLQRPGWTPPGNVFGVVWTILYGLMSVSAWMVTGAANNRFDLEYPAKLAIGAWFTQLALNLAWSLVFFGARRIGASLYVISGLWIAILAYMVLARRVSRVAALLIAPYFAWVSFASALNFRIWRMNRGGVSQVTRHI
jgi:benzodiazapine receptor